MPTHHEHLDGVNNNQDLLTFLIENKRFPDWIAVAAFYKAVHLIEALVYIDHSDKHTFNHEERSVILKTTHRYSNIYRHYRPLWEASLVARYFSISSQKSEYPKFTDYLTFDDVVATLINHNLKQLENSIQKLVARYDKVTIFDFKPCVAIHQ